MGQHGADPQRQAADGADEREKDAAKGHASQPIWQMLSKEGGQHQKRHGIRLVKAHVKPHRHRGQSHGNDDEGGSESPRRRRGRGRSGKDGLYIRLGTENTDDEGEEIRQRRRYSAAEKALPGKRGKYLRKRRPRRKCPVGGDPRPKKAHPDDPHLQEAAHPGALHPPEKSVEDGQEEQNSRRRPRFDPKHRRQDPDPRQAAGHGAQEDAR